MGSLSSSGLSIGGLGERRSLESTAGKAMRMARMLRRKGYAQASEKMALAAAMEKMGTPAIQTQDYRLAKKRQQEELLEMQRRRRAATIAFLNRQTRPPQPPPQGRAGPVDYFDIGTPYGGPAPAQGGALIPYNRTADFQRSENNPHLDRRDDPTSSGFVSNEERRRINQRKQ